MVSCRKKLLSLGLFVLLIFSLAVSSFAKDVKELEQERKALSEKSNLAKDLLEDAKTQKSEVLKEVLALDVELDDATTELEFISSELGKTENLLAETEVSLAGAQESRELQFAAMCERMKFLYENGNVSYLQVIFEAKDFADLINRAEYMAKIIEYDKNMAKELQATEDLIAQKLSEVETQKMEITVLKNQQESRIHALEETLETKNQLVIVLTNDEQKYSQQVNDLEGSSKEIEKMIKDIQAEAARKAAEARRTTVNVQTPVYTGGKFQWPVSGIYTVTSPYGWRTHPINGKRELHTGVDIKAYMGTNILAAESGTVIFSGNKSGYGYTVIIDHGGGISTLYAHNSKLLVSVGETVSRAQVIAKAGSTGYSTGPHCHFEVRVNGAHVNPNSYIGLN